MNNFIVFERIFSNKGLNVHEITVISSGLIYLLGRCMDGNAKRFFYENFPVRVCQWF